MLKITQTNMETKKIMNDLIKECVDDIAEEEIKSLRKEDLKKGKVPKTYTFKKKKVGKDYEITIKPKTTFFKMRRKK